MTRIVLLITLVTFAGCTQERGRTEGETDCRCEGDVPEGRLSVACGEMQCVAGAGGYLCTGPNTAVATPDACFGDGGPPPTDGGTEPPDDGGSTRPDGGETRRDAGGTTTDAGCTEARYYRDADGDGYGDPADPMDACWMPSGYVTNDDDCLDGDRSVNPGADEKCDAVDNDCDGTAAACSGYAGSYAGTYEIYTAERVGSVIVNEMRCTGTSSLTIDVSSSPALTGTVECTYSGGLTAFDSHQTGTVEADLLPDGSITGSVTHQFDRFDSGSRRTFSFAGSVGSSGIDVSGMGSWYPHPMSAVPWDVEVSITATR